MMISLNNLEIVKSTDEEINILDSLDDYYQEFSEMTGQERHFLNSMVLRHKPVKALELGVSAGSSSVILLNAIKENAMGTLYSIDYLSHWYKDQCRKTGFVLDKYPELKEKWKLHTGTFALSFLEQIGDGIDFVLIDTMHVNPGEILDFLMVLPFLKEEALVVFHDTKLYTDFEDPNKLSQITLAFANTNNLLMSVVYGKKYIPMGGAGINLPFNKINMNIPKIEGSEIHFPNIGGIKIDENVKDRIFEVFNLLTIQWIYLPNDDELVEITAFFSKYYDPLLVNHFKEIIFLQKIYTPWFQKNIIHKSLPSKADRMVEKLKRHRIIWFLLRFFYRVAVKFYRMPKTILMDG